jgi:methyl-accepting chemotaxis protein
MKLGVLKRLQFGMMLFGIGMGLIFPLYATFFVEFKPGLQIWFNLGCIIAGIMVGGFSYLLVKWILLGHLRELALACRRISNGQFDVHMDLDSPDEVGEIVHGFNMMSETLREMFEEVTVGVKNLIGVAGNLSAFSHELVQTIGEQRAHVANISTATHEATTTIDEISGNLSQAVGFSSEINKNAGQTDEQLAVSVHVMDKSSKSMVNTLDLMEKLSKQSAEISSILAIIGEIAQQTNLLALNATVEAARAGKHGRGFAVVAGEVKELSVRTAKATQEIEEMVSAFQDDFKQTITGVEDHAAINQSLHEMMSSSSGSINEIITSINKISQMLEQVSGAAKDQVSAYHNIDVSMGSINQAFNEVLEGTDNLVNESDSILKFTSHLQSILQRFEKTTQLQLAA